MTQPLAFTAQDHAAFAWPFFYAHGQAEAAIAAHFHGTDIGAPDLVGANLSPIQVGEGVHDATLLGKPAKVYLWQGRQSWRGYVVLAADDEANAFAQARMAAKSEFC